MPFTIPQPIKPLPGGVNLVVLPSQSFELPKEGRRYIPIEIDWDGAGTTFQVNVQGSATQPFSQMVMFDVDNTSNGSQVTFFFPDSTDTLTVSAGSAGLFPIFTSGLLFYAASPTALASDVTRVRVLNYRQEPDILPPPVFNNVAGSAAPPPAGTNILIPHNVSGTLTGYNIHFSGVAAAAAISTWTGTLRFPGGATIDQGQAMAANGQSVNVVALSATNIAVRFSGGIDLVGVDSGNWQIEGLTYSVFWRTP